MQLKKSLQLLATLILSVFAIAANAQEKFSISGTVKDSATGEDMIGVSVYIKELKSAGIVTNSYGFYSLTVPKGKYTLVAQSVGFNVKTFPLDVNKDIRLNVQLGRTDNTLQEVVVSSRKKNEAVLRPVMGVEKVSMKEIQNVPVIFGEKDVLKTIQLLPGIQSAGDGNSGFYVRGGSADQNLILLDEAPVYNPSHMLGFFSVFNSDAIKDATIYKGTAPSEYGGRLSSVVDLKMNEGNNKRASVSGGIGLISSRLSVEAPIVKDKGSFIISARRTYADLFLKLSKDTTAKNSTLYFYDINAKGNYKLGEKDRIYLSGYFGRDNFNYNKQFGLDWSNATATLRWNHIFNSKLFSNTSLIFSNYNYHILINNNGDDIKITSAIQDWNFKEDLQWYAGSNHNVKFGINSIAHTFVPGEVTANPKSGINNMELQKKHGWENGAYINDTWTFSDHFNVNYGVRFSSFSLLGPGTFYTYNDDSSIKDSSVYSGTSMVKSYFFAEPRIALSYVINDQHSIKGGYSRNTQNMHLLSTSSTSSPWDVWIPSSNNVKPEIADLFSLGYFRNFKDNQYEFSTELYYKLMQNQIDYKNGADIYGNENVESQLLFGKGRAYGAEFLIKKKSGKLTGWIGYTLAKSERQFAGINKGSWFSARQDRTHDISVVAMYELNKKWTFSADFVYYTGNATTFPSGKYEVDNQVVNYYTERNGYRMPAYHRLDLGATYIVKKTATKESSWTFSLYNAYGRENAYTINFKTNPDDPTKTEAVQVALFKFIPSVTYNFKF